jgi:hypothetical protein
MFPNHGKSITIGAILRVIYLRKHTTFIQTVIRLTINSALGRNHFDIPGVHFIGHIQQMINLKLIPDKAN